MTCVLSDSFTTGTAAATAQVIALYQNLPGTPEIRQIIAGLGARRGRVPSAAVASLQGDAVAPAAGGLAGTSGEEGGVRPDVRRAVAALPAMSAEEVLRLRVCPRATAAFGLPVYASLPLLTPFPSFYPSLFLP